jgi:hypothetical protein
MDTSHKRATNTRDEEEIVAKYAAEECLFRFFARIGARE